MLVRIVHFLIGALLGGGGGYLAWSQRELAPTLFPPGPDGAPWLLIAGVLGALAGLVFLVTAVMPRPKRAAALAAAAADRQATISAADTYYAERARAADRDWRGGDIPAAAAVRPAEPVLRTAPPSPEPAAPTLKPVASSAPPASVATPFPATATLAPIPAAAVPPPAPVAVPVATPVATSAFGAIRAAISEGRLEEADKLLTTGRETAQGIELAELTGLAGDHAAAAGRQSNAKWLWRLALKRFGELGAMDSPAAKDVSERLRLAAD